MSRRSVLVIGSEAVPFAKTGGLADVMGALPPAIARLGWDVTVVLPRYRGVGAGSLVERFPVGRAKVRVRKRPAGLPVEHSAATVERP